MFTKKLFVSLNRADGTFLTREALSLDLAVEQFESFDWATTGAEPPVMVVQSDWEQRIEIRADGDGFAADVTARARRAPALFGLLPGHDGLRRTASLTRPEARALIEAIYTLSRDAFERYVKGEI